MNKCDKCGKEFQYNSLLIRHQLCKNTCDTIENINNNYDKKINDINNNINTIVLKSLETKESCLFCNKTFLNKGNLSRHINKSCEEKKELLNEQNIILDEKNKLIEHKNKLIKEQEDQEKERKRDEEFKTLKNMMMELLEKQATQPIQAQQNITNNITNNINQTNVIMINSFGNEDLSHITLQDYKQYLNSYFKGFIKYIEKVHFDDNMPENHNICITNLKSKDIKVYEGDKWVAKQKTDIIDKFLRKKLNTLIDKCEELEENEDISEKVVDNFSEFQVNYMDDSAKKNTKDDVILMMYNNKDKVKVK
jgi:hypothetical protein